MITSLGLLSGHTHFLSWGVIHISLTNFLIALVMVLLFVLALVLPFPGSHAANSQERPDVTR